MAPTSSPEDAGEGCVTGVAEAGVKSSLKSLLITGAQARRSGPPCGLRARQTVKAAAACEGGPEAGSLRCVGVARESQSGSPTRARGAVR